MKLLEDQALELAQGRLTGTPFLAIRWLADEKLTGHPPLPLWQLSAEDAEDVRRAAVVMHEQAATRAEMERAARG